MDEIIEYQTLSDEFIERNKDKIKWNYLITRKYFSYDFLERNIYQYSLYVRYIDRCVNKKNIIRLQEKYKEKYEIDKLAYELSRK